jgi:hypothetical protein
MFTHSIEQLSGIPKLGDFINPDWLEPSQVGVRDTFSLYKEYFRNKFIKKASASIAQLVERWTSKV